MPFSPCVRLMNHSVNSSRGKASSANKLDQINCAEESGWTSYFEDFSRSIEPSYCSSLGGSSLVSDASSSAAWKKLSHYNNNLAVSSCPNNPSRASPNPPKKLCFKKAIRAKQISEDDSLEDTASSPVNSPKVGDLNSTEIISSKIDGQLDGSMGKGSTSSEHNSDLQTDDDEHELTFNGKSNIDCKDLKKSGLCLVPLSMLVNYLG